MTASPPKKSNLAQAALGDNFPRPRTRYLSHLAIFAPYLVVASVLSAVIYGLVFTRGGRLDNPSLYWAWALIILPLTLSTMTLAAFRQNKVPIFGTFLTILVFFSFGVFILSAMRITLSYSGLLAVLPLNTLLLVLANRRHHSGAGKRVGMLRFDDDAHVYEQLAAKNVLPIASGTQQLENFDVVLIDNSHYHDPEWVDFIARCYLLDIEVMPWPLFMESRLGRIPVSRFFDLFSSHSSGQRLYVQFKRGFDLLAIALFLPIIIVLMCGTAIYIFLRDGGPVLFVHHRAGFGGKPFRLYKFRTMYKGTGGGATSQSDDRIIPGCNFIRRIRLDELPQIYNVLKGDMSLIGPRPEAIDLMKWYRKEIPEYDYRLLLLPGITGWAQVNSGYTSNPDEARVKLSYDLYYIKNISLDLDMEIALRTVKTVILGAGAR